MTSNILRHSLSARLVACALLTVLFSAAVFAQSATYPTRAPNANLIIDHNRMRFDLQGEARNWQIEVFNKAGDLIFGSGVVNNTTLEWPFEDQQGQPLASGLYAYTLKFWNENNDALGVQRGHVIIDRANTNDRIWVTSNNAIGVGSAASELTVTGSPESTIGGAKLTEVAAPAPSRAASERPQIEAGRASISSTDPQQLKSGGINALGVIVGDGTASRIAKFIGANAIDDSNMSETGGKIRINFTGTPTGRLHVVEGFGVASIYGTNMSGQLVPNFPGFIGVHGDSIGVGSIGVKGTGSGTSSIGLYGGATGGSLTTGVLGIGDTGVYGSSANGTGVHGIGDDYGLFGEVSSIGGTGVSGIGFTGLRAESTNSMGFAVFARSYQENHGAGLFVGNVIVTGTLTADTVDGNFAAKIDHPLDPANKYLNQSFVESSEMMSVQNGNITTDANGEAVVALPDYFQAMNGDFRYQLTVIGQFAQAIVSGEINNNQFSIKTDKPNVKVSWQVTGVRQDAAAKANRKPVEELKPEAERGHYLRPLLFGQSEEKSVGWARNPEMIKGMMDEREKRLEARARKSQQ